jgi:hypothetical protein
MRLAWYLVFGQGDEVTLFNLVVETVDNEDLEVPLEL